jgi:ATP-dependent Lon protease
LIAAPQATGLTAEQLNSNWARPHDLGFKTTDDISFDGDWFGQERALAALELGLAIRQPGFNIYVCGLAGTHREQVLADLLERFTSDQPAPGDRVLVNNFRDPDRPRALYLPSGWGRRLDHDMAELIAELKRLLPETFRKETFEEEKERIAETFGRQGEEINKKLGDEAEKAGFVIQQAPGGQIGFVPMIDGRPMTDEELQALTDEKREELRRRHRELQRELKSVLRQHQQLMRQLGHAVKEVERRAAADEVTPLIEELTERYDNVEVRRYLQEVRDHVLDHLSDFQEQSAPPGMLPFLMSPIVGEDRYRDYRVNILVDNSDSKGAPILVESSPTYKNLFGAVERVVDQHGRLVSHFTRVLAGSLLRAHGGCIVVHMINAMLEPLVWRALKQCLKQSRLEIEAYDPFAMFATSALRPEAMAIDTCVVLIGPTELFQLLYFYDEEFREIFKVRADFGFESEGEEARRNSIAAIARIAKSESLPPFTAAAVAAVLEHAARTVGDRRKLPSQSTEIADLMREAAFWARKRTTSVVDAEDVLQALDQRSFRLNRIESKIRELIRDGVLLVNLDGSRIGQVNGLAVSDVGGYEFGRPSRITCTVSLGTHGVVAVDREARLSGKAYDKAVLIIGGYLRHVYAQQFPLSLAASLSFEQSYSGIEGDSASAAEIFAMISSLSGLALRQDLAVTGSVNQFGEVQPVGGVNEKVEGFFYACKEVGLTGAQGVIIPRQNVDHLTLHREVVEAVGAERFHIYPIGMVDEGLELLTGVKAGDVTEAGTVHALAARHLRRMAYRLRRFAAAADKPAAADPTRKDIQSQ